MAEKQMIRVLRCIQKGADTSNEVAEMTRLPLHVCSHWICELISFGLIRRNGRWKHFHQNKYKSLCVEPADASP